ncbi:MAG: hypothetical protein HC838_17095, partial [Spirulinaceae cyanobacterium RM2_2_10]|nr:hypothetical protein [Spirulinaceae cyanobacterium RM2_2_10]
ELDRAHGLTRVHHDPQPPRLDGRALEHAQLAGEDRLEGRVGQLELTVEVQGLGVAKASPKAQAILADWSHYLGQFWQVVPPSEAEAPEAQADAATGKALSSV